jgi:phosphate transport system permease protein
MNTATNTAPTTPNALTTNAAMSRRMLTDSIFKHTMTVGGISVIIAVSAIFFYLASVVVPLFTAPTIDQRASYAVPSQSGQSTLAFTGEEQREIGAHIGSAGAITFFRFDTGQRMSETQVPVPPDAQVTSADLGERRTFAQGFGLSNGQVILAKLGFDVTFPNNKRLITPGITYPLGEQPVQLDPNGQPIKLLGVQNSDSGSTVVGLTADNRLLISGIKVEMNPITGAATSTSQTGEISSPPTGVRRLLIESKQRELFVLHGDRDLARYDISNTSSPQLIETVQLAPAGQRVTAMAMLSGGFSLIVGTDKGELAQWFPVRVEGTKFALTRIRGFKPMPAAVTAVAPEFFRKGFIVGDEKGNFGSYYATSERLLFVEKLSDKPLVALGVPPRGNGYLAQDAAGKVYAARVDNHYPEVSFSALWQKVWYESYEQPDYVWQSSAANEDFEPKFSVAPLTYGTIKAAAYAMLLAVPLAIFGAIFTAYFMSAKMSSVVKPTIEIMGALPTVVLGFLAGLWLAPLVENNLAGVLMSMVLLPASIVLASYLWHLAPVAVKQRVPGGWEAALLMPIIASVVWLVFQLGHPIEAAFFGGDMPNWLSNTMGIKYEQRNSIVVGIAMGFAVAPVIFSIAEDAIFNVPKSLTSGSLALGATPWQTLMGVVLLTASPGIFSAVMIGLGRAVGETMIVLMATGNTAVMDFSMFSGFRTLAANIGVEMPEAGVGETHYRLLFMSALVLFAFTFVVNTIAEIVRARLRDKYQTI